MQGYNRQWVCMSVRAIVVTYTSLWHLWNCSHLWARPSKCPKTILGLRGSSLMLIFSWGAPGYWSDLWSSCDGMDWSMEPSRWFRREGLTRPRRIAKVCPVVQWWLGYSHIKLPTEHFWKPAQSSQALCWAYLQCEQYELVNVFYCFSTAIWQVPQTKVLLVFPKMCF